MSAQIPTPSALAQRFIAALSAQQFIASDGTTVTLDAMAPATFESALAILAGLTDYEIYLYLRDQLLELMVTTATVTPGTGLLPQHAKIWGVPRVGATAAVGYFLMASTATAPVTVPAGTAITVDGTVQWTTDNAVTVAAGATVSVAVTATVTDVAGNLAPNTVATLVSPVSGIGTVVSDQNGLTGGAPVEGVESWRARIIDEIRNPPGAGTVADYTKWAKDAGALVVNVVPAYTGPGTVGILFLASDYAVPSPAQVTAMQAAIDAKRPVRGNATVYAAEVVPQNPQIQLNPDTAAARTAVQDALAPYYLSVGLGGRVYVEALQAQISTAAGQKNTLVSPTQDFTLAANQQPVLGAINWGDAS
ncbi:baseplate J/gp47 family protein [Gluconobacter sp. LMG 31484]|uniref:Baseplate J/gp47 family protein n=1 Tax=Gluconobacter vitians TaxID=2728102 RepID=A0ABR9Y4X6_9PROT|nr:baseplate J/gp47 family protein [Gluconobacter vitians]MBF0858790.1 baseplate J/gp47 family protein [Gluconobacter vitians]